MHPILRDDQRRNDRILQDLHVTTDVPTPARAHRAPRTNHNITRRFQ
jgi:hypothetical protein